MTIELADIQRFVGVEPDGKPGPNTYAAIAAKLGMATPARFEAEAWAAMLANRNAPAIVDSDYAAAATRLNAPIASIKAIARVESGAMGSFDAAGRPTMLFEPHIFARETQGQFSGTHPDISYARWGTKPYPRDSWPHLTAAAALDENAALRSASWGKFQIMGFHAEALGYADAKAMVASMVASEAGHLEALVRFIEKNGLAPALRRCKAGDPDSCREFAKRYNGAGYERGSYHVKIANALGRAA